MMSLGSYKHRAKRLSSCRNSPRSAGCGICFVDPTAPGQVATRVFSLGVFIALAVILHKIPEGVTIASVMVAAGGSKRRALIATGILAIATLGGALLMSRLAAFTGIALAISSGIALYVAATDLIPELNQRREKGYSVSALLGVVLYFGVFWLLRTLGLHS